MKQIIVPKDEAEWLGLRTQDITSTEVPALFNISPYFTEYELHHRKAGRIAVKFEENVRTIWGNRLQDSIAYGIEQDQGWKIRPMKEYIRDSELRIGSSFDFAIQVGREVTLEDESFEHPRTSTIWDNEGLLEIKNVDAMIFKDGWLIGEDGEVEAPPHIEMQVQHQLLVSGYMYAYVGALVGGNRVILSKRMPDPFIHEQILLKVARFWEGVDSGTPPPPDFSKDLETIARLHNYAEPGSLLDWSGDRDFEALMQDYKAASEMEKKAKAIKDEAKARILMGAGQAEKVLWSGGSVSMSVVGPAIIETYERAGFRRCVPYFKKEKKS